MPHKPCERWIQGLELRLSQAKNRLDTTYGNRSIENQRVIAQRPTRRDIPKKGLLILGNEPCRKKSCVKILHGNLKLFGAISVQDFHIVRPDLRNRASHPVDAIVIGRDNKRAQLAVRHTAILSACCLGKCFSRFLKVACRTPTGDLRIQSFVYGGIELKAKTPSGCRHDLPHSRRAYSRISLWIVGRLNKRKVLNITR